MRKLMHEAKNALYILAKSHIEELVMMQALRIFSLGIVTLVLVTHFQVQAARTISVNNKQVITGKVYELSSLMDDPSSLDEFYTIVESHTVLIDFYADWCGPCAKMDPVFKELAQETDQVLFIKIDTKFFGFIGREYGIKSIPYFISFKNGHEVARIAGSRNKKELKKLSGVC